MEFEYPLDSKTKRFYFIDSRRGKTKWRAHHCRILARAECFKNPKEMFEYYDDKYDLSSPKKFWVTRGRWL